jgi:hypothetical protein
MKNLLLTLALVMTTSFTTSAFAQNDVYGSVSEIHYRAGNTTNDPSQLYFRLNVTGGNTEPCMLNGTNITWNVDLDSKLHGQIISLLEKSREETKEIRVLGMHNVCDGSVTESDTVFEISPNWNPM